MNYPSETFKNCQFNPYEEFPFKAYPQLVNMVVEDTHTAGDENEGETDNHVFIPMDKAVRYIIALYDPKSPLIKGESNLIRRKEVAASIAGFDLDEQEEVLNILYECKYDCIVATIQNFLKDFVKNMEWAMLVSYESTFWEFQSRLMQPIERGDKDKDLMSAIQTKTKLSEDIKGLYEKYQAALGRFYGEEEVLIENAGKIRRFTPEHVGSFSKATK